MVNKSVNYILNSKKNNIDLVVKKAKIAADVTNNYFKKSSLRKCERQ